MSLISRYEHLPRRARSDEARPLLEKIASQVKPIMTKRGWKVGTLAEVCTSWTQGPVGDDDQGRIRTEHGEKEQLQWSRC